MELYPHCMVTFAGLLISEPGPKRHTSLLSIFIDNKAFCPLHCYKITNSDRVADFRSSTHWVDICAKLIL